MQTQQPQPFQPLHGAIIDAEGREIPITEQMIQQACHELEQILHELHTPARLSA